jgi:Zn-finger nucleic acid-binding protein
VAKPKPDEQLQCPRCIKRMHKQKSSRAVIDHCDECDGNFFDEGEMLALLGKSADPEVWARSNRKRTPSASDITCPRCHARMHLHPLGQDDVEVDIDFCIACGGIWLDGGEVEAVMKLGARELGQAARSRKKGAASGAADSGPEMIGKYLSLFSKRK